MGEIHEPKPVLLLIAVSSRHDDALAWTEARAAEQFGPLASKSEAFDFTETDYYESTMGVGLKKQFLAFGRLIDPAELAAVKCCTNEWEAKYAVSGRHAEPRPLNLDPGYVTLAKLVLASTKDHAHRIYLAAGIYAELTLQYRKGDWQPCQWTYPDYRREDFQEFFSHCREALRR
jgi:hypothetical protein